jgi:ferrochelatase
MKYKDNSTYHHTSSNKVGVLLVNLGTPEQPNRTSLRTYLKEFLSDPRVVEVPRLIWFFVLNLIILPFRSGRSAKAYQGVWQNDGSPLMVHSKNLTEKVSAKLSDDYVVELAMRYGNPSISDAIDKLMSRGANKLLILPLYPQYSATTTASTFDALADALKSKRYVPEVRFINHYHDHPSYIQALVTSIGERKKEFSKTSPLLLSYHGIPKRYWDNGDPYPCHCFKTSRLLKEALGLDDDAVKTTFQSRFGREEWVKPYTDETLKSMPQGGIKSVNVMCPGFAVDCLETIEEIEEENKEYFEKANGEHFHYIPCLNDSEAHASLIQTLIEEQSQGWQIKTAHPNAQIEK